MPALVLTLPIRLIISGLTLLSRSNVRLTPPFAILIIIVACGNHVLESLGIDLQIQGA